MNIYIYFLFISFQFFRLHRLCLNDEALSKRLDAFTKTFFHLHIGALHPHRPCVFMHESKAQGIARIECANIACHIRVT
jgi:hypothetical protein